MSWTKIEEVTLSSSQASVTLGTGGTLPQTYKTLKLVMSTRSDANTNNAFVQPNNVTANRSGRLLFGSGTSTGSQTNSTIEVGANNSTYTANTFNSAESVFPNYSSTTMQKPSSTDSVQENNAAGAYQFMVASLWADTAAITSLVIVPGAGNFVSGSTFTLYGLK